jgi:hypothetical protein
VIKHGFRSNTGGVSSSSPERCVFSIPSSQSERTLSTLQFLRSAFSVYPRTVPTEAQIPLSGNETITTMGWYRDSATWGYTFIPITIVALMIYAAVAYSLWHVFGERGHESFTMFDPSNPIHVMMVSSTRDNGAKDNLDDWLGGFEHDGIGKNENLEVQLTNVTQYRKRFRVTDN